MKPSFDKKPVKEVVREVVIRELPAQQMTTVTPVVAAPVVNPNYLTMEAAQKMTNDAVSNALERYSKVQPVAVVKQEEEGFGLSNKLVKELKDVVGVFTALKEISSNPLQTMIEQKVGSMAAGVVERSFGAPPQQNQDIIDRILNSQFGAGIGAALGQRAPELVDKLTGTFGKEKTQNWMDTALSGRGGGGIGGGSGGGGIPGAPLPEGGQGGQGQIGGGGNGQQSEADIICQLDPNNPEHITAYAASQGGIPNDVARKMLMVHQDAFIKQMEKNGQIDKANETMMKRNDRLLNERDPLQENIQEYRRPAGVESMSYSDGSQNLDVEEQKVDFVPDDVKKRQLEPEALVTNDSMHPQMKPEDVIFENGSVVDSGQEQQEQEQQQPDINVGAYLKSLTEMVGKLYDNVNNQNEVILQLQNDLNVVKENDIEKTRKKMEKADQDTFAGVRKTKGIKIGG